MYLPYYKLSKKPFQISTDPSFFWLGEKHKEALALLRYGVMDDKGFLLLTGDVGTGKTTLINTFINSLGDEVVISRISDPGLTQLDFINYLAQLFKIETEFKTKSEFLILFTDFLEQADRDDKKVLLIIDEAQHLTEETLEEIRLLSNIEKQDKKLLNIFLVGQNEFNEKLGKYKNRALRQRLTLNYTLYPLEIEETRACIEYRLKVAGVEHEIFTPEAIESIHNLSCGFPRVINIICDHALRLGCQEDQQKISVEIIAQCSKTLHAVHFHSSHKHENHLGSTSEWLEESEVPPLSPEEIDRVSQPLPEFIIDEVEDEKVPRRYGATVPLLVAVLLISLFFLFKDNNLALFKNFLTSLQKNTIAVIENQKKSRTDSQEILQKVDTVPPLKDITNIEEAAASPIVINKERIKQRFKVQTTDTFKTDLSVTYTQVDETELTKDSLPQVDLDIAQTTIGESTGIEIEDISVEEPGHVEVEILQHESFVADAPKTVIGEVQNSYKEDAPEPVLETPQPSVTQARANNEKKSVGELQIVQPQPEKSLPETIIKPPKADLNNGTADVEREFKEYVPVTSEPATVEDSNMTETQSTEIQEEQNIEVEVLAEPPIQPIKDTTITAEDVANTEAEYGVLSKKESGPKNLNPAIVTKKKQSSPTPSSSKEPANTNDDPGAVIDWLLKAEQN